MGNHPSILVLSTAAFLSLVDIGCSQVNFATLDKNQGQGLVTETLISSITMPYGKTLEQFTQDSFAKNTVTLQFQVSDIRGNIAALTTGDLIFKENSLPISGIDLSSTTHSIGRKADIVFVIDDTGSMQRYIDSVKLKVTGFVDALGGTNIQASLCLVTFGDEVHSRCDRFIEDNPATPANENLQAFLDDLSRVRASGGGDEPENQLLGLVAAATGTPWHADSQRIAVLMTDASFHYAPDHLGQAATAPAYADALNAVVANQMMTFAVAPDLDGFSKPFALLPAISQGSGGIWFNFNDVVSGTTNLGDIFNSIVDRLSVVYVAKYIVDDNPSLDPTLPLAARRLEVTPTDPAKNWHIQLLNLSSNLPGGRPNYRKQFPLQTDSIDLASLKVMVDGAPWLDFQVLGNQLTFRGPPAPGARIQAEYLKMHLRENLRMLPLTIELDNPTERLEVMANHVRLSPDEFSLNQVDARTFLINLDEALFDDRDRLNIGSGGALVVDVYTIR